ncbi:MAG: hypothetical protein ACRED4_00890, partial [Brevundimonas sp.]
RFPMIRLLDFPGAERLQARMELLPQASPTSDARTRELLEGIAGVLGFKLDWGGWIDYPPLAPGEELIDIDPYLDAELDGEGIAFWRERGWDIAGPNGKRVSFFDMVRTPLIIVEEGRCGCSKMEVEAALWSQGRSSQPSRDPVRKRQDAAFLNLGTPSRRRA